MAEQYLSIEQAAQYLGVQPATFRGWCRTRKVPAIRFGNRWRCTVSALDKHMARCAIEPVGFDAEEQELLDELELAARKVSPGRLSAHLGGLK